MRFTPGWRGGAGPALVCLHGFADTWRTWEPVLPALSRRHEVLAPTLPGHAGGAPLPSEVGLDGLADAVEAEMDAAGRELAHLVGSSLGGHLALRLASRGRARSVVAFAPAGGWLPGDPSRGELLDAQERMIGMLRAAAPHAEALVATSAGRRQVTRELTVRHEHLPPELLAHLVVAAGACPGARALLAAAREADWALDPARVTGPVRIVWGTRDRLLPWPGAAAQHRAALPHADWVVLEDVGHYPQLDVPLEAAELILGFTA
jgi:pimeloyl-ACP methyl ester carboxylesterase